jgi:hypothetical protein
MAGVVISTGDAAGKRSGADGPGVGRAQYVHQAERPDRWRRGIIAVLADARATPGLTDCYAHAQV